MSRVTFPTRFRDLAVPRRVEVRWVGAMSVPVAQAQEPVHPVCTVFRRIPDAPRATWWYRWALTDRYGAVLLEGIEEGAARAGEVATEAARLWMQGRRPEIAAPSPSSSGDAEAA